MPAAPPIPAAFAPPTAEQVQAHLERHPPRPPSPALAWLPLAALVGAVVLALRFGGALALLLPWLVLLAILGVMGWRAYQLRQVEFALARAHEMALTRHWADALRAAWGALPLVTASPELHARAVALIAQTLDRLAAHEAAIVAYGYLIERLPADHPGAVQLRVQCAIAQLASDRLLDADQTLRRLRGTIEAFGRTAIGALYRLAELIQQVRTRHFADAVAAAPGLLEDLRPLGLEAGYGHALLALSYAKLAQQAPPHDGSDAEAPGAAGGWDQAQLWWRRATLLLPPAALVHRFAELDEVAPALSSSPAPAALPPAPGAKGGGP